MKVKHFIISRSCREESRVEEFVFDETVKPEQVLKVFTSLTENQIKDALYAFEIETSYLYEENVNNKLVEIFFDLHPLYIITAENLGEY